MLEWASPIVRAHSGAPAGRTGSRSLATHGHDFELTRREIAEGISLFFVALRFTKGNVAPHLASYLRPA